MKTFPATPNHMIKHTREIRSLRLMKLHLKHRTLSSGKTNWQVVDPIGVIYAEGVAPSRQLAIIKSKEARETILTTFP